MSEVKSIEELILEIASNKEYENSAIEQWYNRKRNEDNERNGICQSFG